MKILIAVIVTFIVLVILGYAMKLDKTWGLDDVLAIRYLKNWRLFRI